MRSGKLSIHGINEISIKRDESEGAHWTTVQFVGPRGTFEIVAFSDDGFAKVIDLTDDAEPEGEPRGPYEPVGYADDMRNAGRGDLLGER